MAGMGGGETRHALRFVGVILYQDGLQAVKKQRGKYIMIEGFYDKIDALITDSIRNGENPLQNHLCIAESVLLSNVLGMREGDSFRVIDRRLQHLRKKRKIEHIKKDAAISHGKVVGWNVID